MNRSQAIRTAYLNPNLRKSILPKILKQAAEKKIILENDAVRVTMNGHPEHDITVQEMPGKPLKRQVRRYSFQTPYIVQQSSAFMVENVIQDARLSSSMSFDQVVKAIEDALEVAKERAMKGNSRLGPISKDVLDKYRIPEGLLIKREVPYLEVEPKDYKPIQFVGKDFSGNAKYHEFNFRSSEKDYGAEMSPFYQGTSAASARKLFKLLKADPDFCKNMTLKDFEAGLGKAKIGYKYVPSVWR